MRYGRPAGITSLRYGTTVRLGLTETWPILALRMLGEGYAWPQVVLELGLPNDYWYNGGADGGGGGGGGG